MKTTHGICAHFVCLSGAVSTLPAQTPAPPSLHGTITDPSGALVPGALVQLRGPGGEQRKTTDIGGQYNFPVLRGGKYTVRIIAKGFSVSSRQDFDIGGPITLDAQLTIEADTQVLNVEDEAGSVTADPDSNAGALVLREKELAA
ncbi:MAG TPA: carboxypeptidase-like regulatory domain-containing protein, partial [Candidatus Solibacter sp.]|nr:carboxypeptidase-like regulatory domain-containing protein [Candidatus Solibacter sp.]